MKNKTDEAFSLSGIYVETTNPLFGPLLWDLDPNDNNRLSNPKKIIEHNTRELAFKYTFEPLYHSYD